VEHAAVTGGAREIVTPEGLPLRFEVAAAADRLGAFLFDGLIIVLATLVVLIPLLVGRISGGSDWLLAMAFLAAFAIRHGYFVWFETRRHGSTPGKRRARLRVIDRSGGALTAEAVFARNLTREVEVMLPLVLLLSPDALLPEAPGWGIALGCAWIVVVGALPLLNRDRLRVGDLVAGTIVVRSPEVVLLRDLSAAPEEEGRERLPFTPAQLGVYGIFELQVLEEILRSETRDRAGMEAVCQRIQRKIGWDPSGQRVSAEKFLRDFYDAQRAHLEGRLLMGERRERKAERPGRQKR
jgi:uncharacterized RDD family membrane protein YckC